MVRAYIELDVPVPPALWKVLWSMFVEHSTRGEDMAFEGLWHFKPRVDVYARTPRLILSAFAEVTILRRRTDVNKMTHAVTKNQQRGVLRRANEIAIALEAARRACDSEMLFQAVSEMLTTMAPLTNYRTKPVQLFDALIRCAVSLNDTDSSIWDPHARAVYAALSHELLLLSVQQRVNTILQPQANMDLAARYMCRDKPVESLRSMRAVEDFVTEATLCGIDTNKLQHVLGDAAGALLEQIPKDPTGAAATALEQNLTIALLALARHMDATLVSTFIGQHAVNAILNQYLRLRRQEFRTYGFMLRALPRHVLNFPSDDDEGKDDETKEHDSVADGDGGSVNREDNAAADEEEEHESTHSVFERLQSANDVEQLAMLELMQAKPLLQQVEQLRFHYSDIGRFTFLNLEQVEAPDLDGNAATPAVEEHAASDKEEEEEEREIGDMERHEREDGISRKESIESCARIVRHATRACTLAFACKNVLQMQKCFSMVLNALLVAQPEPTECISSGFEENPEDVDPDNTVGQKTNDDGVRLAGKLPNEAGDADDVVSPSGMWLDLVILADLCVSLLQSIKARGVGKEHVQSRLTSDLPPTDGRLDATLAGGCTVPGAYQQSLPSANDSTTVSPEDAILQQKFTPAWTDISVPWFDSLQQIDVENVAKIAAFAAQCLFHMRRWTKVISLCREFNEASDFVWAKTFLPLAQSAQERVCGWSRKAIETTKRYMNASKEDFETEQKQIPRKVLRQLAMHGELSKPEKLYRQRLHFYENILTRQQQLHARWDKLEHTLREGKFAARQAFPKPLEQLRLNRVDLQKFLHANQTFVHDLAKNNLDDAQKAIKERDLRLQLQQLLNGYQNTCVALRKHKLMDEMTQALHEQANLFWLQGDHQAAATRWNDGVDCAFEFVYALKNWRGCVQELSGPTVPKRAVKMLLTTVMLYKLCYLPHANDSHVHLDGALFAAHIVHACLDALPHPSRRMRFSPSQYRMREIFYCLRTNDLFPPNALDHGVDGRTFLRGCWFFIEIVLLNEYHVTRALPMGSLYHYVATDICRNLQLSVSGRLLVVRALLKSEMYDDAWWALYAIVKGHDLPRDLLTLDTVDEAKHNAAYPHDGEDITAFNVSEDLESGGANAGAVDVLAGWELGEDLSAKYGPLNCFWFTYCQAEFIVKVVTMRPEGPNAYAKQKLQQAQDMLTRLWEKTTTHADDCTEWHEKLKTAHATNNKNTTGPQTTTQTPDVEVQASVESEERSLLCLRIRLLMSEVCEACGSLGGAVQHILYAMHFLVKASKTATGTSRTHADMKYWGRLRRRMVVLLLRQGRVQAALAHIREGLAESHSANDGLGLVELLLHRARVEILQGQRVQTAYLTLEECLAMSEKYFPGDPPLAAVEARMLTYFLLKEHDAVMGGKGTTLLGANTMATRTGKEGNALYCEIITQAMSELDYHLTSQGILPLSQDRNKLYHIAPIEFREDRYQPFLAPETKHKVQSLWKNDTRARPNLYVSLWPMRVHMDLLLAHTIIDMRDMPRARPHLQRAEEWMPLALGIPTRFIVKLAALKLRWRRCYPDAPPPFYDVIPDLWTQTALRDGVCPMPFEPTFRTFVNYQQSPPLGQRLRWHRHQETLSAYLRELGVMVDAATNSGGNDNELLQNLLVEGLLEVIAHIASRGKNKDGENSATAVPTVADGEEGAPTPENHVAVCYSLFQLLVQLEAKTSNLQLRAMQIVCGGNAGSAPAALLADMPQVNADLMAHLARQSFEGAREVSLGSEKSPPLLSVVRHFVSCRLECKFFDGFGMHLKEQLLCDRLHTALKQHVPTYAAQACVDPFPDMDVVKGEEAPRWKADEVIFFWTPLCSNSPTLRLIAFLAPEDGPACVVLRFPIEKAALNELQCTLQHVSRYAESATAFGTEFVRQQLARVWDLLGPESDRDAQSPINALLGDPTDDTLEQEDTLIMFQALVVLLQAASPGATSVAHKGLCSFLGILLEQFVVN
eukprot:GEMP01000529.1.p1 GENE.GEMP01000529.1~~GEMP01000529.1.p1  ORF type:complete len:2060 (+),score=594.87 GEMP01000529.1:228-6182(+)